MVQDHYTQVCDPQSSPCGLPIQDIVIIGLHTFLKGIGIMPCLGSINGSRVLSELGSWCACLLQLVTSSPKKFFFGIIDSDIWGVRIQLEICPKATWWGWKMYSFWLYWKVQYKWYNIIYVNERSHLIHLFQNLLTIIKNRIWSHFCKVNLR